MEVAFIEIKMNRPKFSHTTSYLVTLRKLTPRLHWLLRRPVNITRRLPTFTPPNFIIHFGWWCSWRLRRRRRRQKSPCTKILFPAPHIIVGSYLPFCTIVFSIFLTSSWFSVTASSTGLGRYSRTNRGLCIWPTLNRHHRHQERKKWTPHRTAMGPVCVSVQHGSTRIRIIWDDSQTGCGRWWWQIPFWWSSTYSPLQSVQLTKRGLLMVMFYTLPRTTRRWGMTAAVGGPRRVFVCWSGRTFCIHVGTCTVHRPHHCVSWWMEHMWRDDDSPKCMLFDLLIRFCIHPWDS